MKLDDIILNPLMDTLRLEKISDEVYFSKPYAGYISNSRLGLLNPLQEGTPEKFFEGFTDQGYNPSFQLGSRVHEQILQPEYFELAPDLMKPSAKLGEVAERLYKHYLNHTLSDENITAVCTAVDYYASQMSAARIQTIKDTCHEYWTKRKEFEKTLNTDKTVQYCDAKLLDSVSSCVNNLRNHPQVSKLLHPEGILETPISECEQAILLDIEAKLPNGKSVILKLKAKLDNYTIDKESNTVTVNDVKTYRSDLVTNIYAFRYSREFAVYHYLLSKCCEKFYGMKDFTMKGNYLGVQTQFPFSACVLPVKQKDFKKGLLEMDRLLKYAAYLIGYKNYKFNV